jgi:hypothetical protein
MTKEEIFKQVDNKNLFYVFRCSVYPNGYLCHSLKKVIEKNLFGEEKEYLVAQCVLTNNRIWVVKNPYLKVKKKHIRIVKKWLDKLQ